MFELQHTLESRAVQSNTCRRVVSLRNQISLSCEGYIFGTPTGGATFWNSSTYEFFSHASELCGHV